MRDIPRVCALVVMIACGGGAAERRAAPLASHFDEMYIASIPIDQKQSIVQAQQEWNVARMEQATADAQLKESESQLYQARNDEKASRLAIDSAISNKNSASAAADTNRISQTTKELAAAQNAGKAASSRVRYLETYREYLQRHVRYMQEAMYWREAQLEAAKAKLAENNHINPQGVAFDAFPRQVEERHKRVQTARSTRDGAKVNVGSYRDTWRALQAQADRDSGHSSTHWDPMATAVPTPTAANL